MTSQTGGEISAYLSTSALGGNQSERSFFDQLKSQSSRPASILVIPKDDNESEATKRRKKIDKSLSERVIPPLFEKKHTKFDQMFINDEEDGPVETRRFFPNVRDANSGNRAHYTLNLRNPNVKSEVQIKPLDFTIR